MTTFIAMKSVADDKRLPVGRSYVRRSAAFKLAERLAKQTGQPAWVWEYRGPGDSTFHKVEVPSCG